MSLTRTILFSTELAFRTFLIVKLAGTYPLGFEPPTQAIFDNTRSYKNKQAGVFFHNSHDLKISGGVLADNGIQADFDRADNIAIQGTDVLGSTARFNEIVSSQSGRFGHEEIIGLQLHSFALAIERDGATIVDVRFDGFANAQSSRVTLIDIDSSKLSGHFDYWYVQNSSFKFTHFCPSTNLTVDLLLQVNTAKCNNH